MPALCAVVLADVFTDPASYQVVGFLFLGLAGIAGALNQFLAAAVNWRKIKEPERSFATCPVECAKLKVLEAELRAVEMRMEKRLSETLGSVNTRLGTLETTLSHLVGDFNYAIGKIDAQNTQG